MTSGHLRLMPFSRDRVRPLIRSLLRKIGILPKSSHTSIRDWSIIFRSMDSLNWMPRIVLQTSGGSTVNNSSNSLLSIRSQRCCVRKSMLLKIIDQSRIEVREDFGGIPIFLSNDLMRGRTLSLESRMSLRWPDVTLYNSLLDYCSVQGILTCVLSLCSERIEVLGPVCIRSSITIKIHSNLLNI